MAPSMIPGCETSLSVLNSIFVLPHGGGSLVKCGLRSLLKSVLETLLVCVAKHGRLDPPPDRVLSRVVSSAVPLTMGEWMPLMGDLGFLSTEANVRSACVRALVDCLGQAALRKDIGSHPLLESRVWLCRHLFGSEESNDGSSPHQQAHQQQQQQAEALWVQWVRLSESEGVVPLSPVYHAAFAPLLLHKDAIVRNAAARASAAAIAIHPSTAADTIHSMQCLFTSSMPERAAAPPRGAGGSSTAQGAGVAGGSKGGKGAKGSKGDKVEKIDISTLKFTVAPTTTAPEDTKYPCREAIATFVGAVGNEKVLNACTDDANAVRDLVTALLSLVLTWGVMDPKDAVREKMVAGGRQLIDGYADLPELCDAMRIAIEAVIAQPQQPGV